MEDRAQVTRHARAELTAGRHTLHLGPITPLVADRTLRCRVRAAGTGRPEKSPRVLDVQVKRRYLVKPSRPEKEREITGAIEKLADEYLRAHDQMRMGFDQHRRVAGAGQGLATQIADRMVVGPFDPKWPGEIRELFDRREKLEEALLTAQVEQEDRLEHLERLLEERRQALQPVSDYQAGLVCNLWIPGDGTWELEWEYQVPCALWRPEYSAELLEGEAGEEVDWQSAGSVWQATGEDWEQVELSFSTARPTLGAELPLLDDDVLSARSKTDQEKKIIEVTSRDEEIQTTSTTPEDMQSDTPPGLDDGGETRTYRVLEKVDVPSDGRPHRLAFETWKAPAECGFVCMPERAGFVFLRSVQANPSGMPLLAGPVSLIRNGGYVGRSQVGYVASQETFSLSWGSEDGLVVLRDVVRKFEETGLRKKKSYTFEVEAYLANYTGEARQIRLTERIPVSEIEQVEIEIDKKKTEPGYQKDDQGHLTWNLKLQDTEEKRVKLSYQVSMPAKVHWNG